MQLQKPRTDTAEVARNRGRRRRRAARLNPARHGGISLPAPPPGPHSDAAMNGLPQPFAAHRGDDRAAATNPRP